MSLARCKVPCYNCTGKGYTRAGPGLEAKLRWFRFWTWIGRLGVVVILAGGLGILASGLFWPDDLDNLRAIIISLGLVAEGLALGYLEREVRL